MQRSITFKLFLRRKDKERKSKQPLASRLPCTHPDEGPLPARACALFVMRVRAEGWTGRARAGAGVWFSSSGTRTWGQVFPQGPGQLWPVSGS